MALDTNKVPIVIGSTSLSARLTVLSEPTMVNEILWSDISSSCSLTLLDANSNLLFHAVAEGATRVIEDPRLLANGLEISLSTGMEDGKLFVWVR